MTGSTSQRWLSMSRPSDGLSTNRTSMEWSPGAANRHAKSTLCWPPAGKLSDRCCDALGVDDQFGPNRMRLAAEITHFGGDIDGSPDRCRSIGRLASLASW